MSDEARPHVPATRPQEIAPGVYCLEVGSGMMRSNVYLVRSATSWVLIDTGSAKCEGVIENAAAAVFGANTPPAAILLTHDHPDHAGSAQALTRQWGCTVYVHPDELALVTMTPANYIATVEQYAGPIDRWVMLPMLRLMSEQKRAAMLAASTFRDAAAPLDPGGSVPHLSEWQYIPTPGHTPGHISFFRPADRVLITGDAVLTVQMDSLWRFMLSTTGRDTPGLSGPPRISTWNWTAAKQSLASLAELEPRVVASGHGLPMCGDGVAAELRAFANALR